jgi:two-component system, chemotaxis family, response regulator Rcp1
MRLLIVEDNPADAYITQLALRQQLQFEAIVVDDGAPAIAYLKREGQYDTAERPDAVILDLNLKTVDGLDVLRWMRAKPDLASIPVIVLSSSPADAQGEAAARATCYVQKPGTLDEYMDVGRIIRTCLEDAGTLASGGHA